jgi:hypothetical protein
VPMGSGFDLDLLARLDNATDRRHDAFPRTIDREAHLLIAWNPVANCEYEYEYNSGRSDGVSEDTDATELDFNAAPHVTYVFRVRSATKRILGFLGGSQKSDWASVSVYVPAQQRVRKYLARTDASTGFGRLLRSRRLDPRSVIRLLRS